MIARGGERVIMNHINNYVQFWAHNYDLEWNICHIHNNALQPQLCLAMNT